MGGEALGRARTALRSAAAITAVLLLGAGASASVGAKPTGRSKPPAKPKSSAPVTLFPAQTAGPPLMGLGVEWDPYDSFRPSPALWDLIEQRAAFISPGFIRVVEPASGYFAGYDSSHNPTYRWSSTHVQQLLQILAFAQAHHITVVLGDWADPLINDDPRVPAEFIQQLRDTYGITDIDYYDPMNEPNYNTNCAFTCWTNVITSLHNEFAQLGMSWIQLVGPSDGNSWDDTAAVQAADVRTGLDTDNPANDAWVTKTLQAIPSQIGGYASHRYSTIWGIENGVYEDQMLTRRDEISNLDSPAKPYFEGEVGLTVRMTDPFAQALTWSQRRMLPALVDPSAHATAGTFTDSQPHIGEFDYGTWMGDMIIQAIDGGLSGASAWDLDDAMHTGGGYGTDNLKKWGFWNSLGGQDGYPASDLDLRPWYYAWSILSRSFPAGAQALTVPSTGLAGVRVAAVRIPRKSGYALSFALVNEDSSARTIKLFVHYVRHRMNFAVYHYFAGEQPTDANGFPVPAETLHGVDLTRGYSVTLPSQGLVVLSSLGLSSTKLFEGSRTLTDDFGSFRDVYERSKGLRIDTSNPLVFDGDKSRATVSKKGARYLIYRLHGITSFQLKLFAKAGAVVGVYTSSDDKHWTSVPLASTPSAPSLEGRGWYLDELLPLAPLLPAAFLKVEIPSGHIELAQMRIQSG